jgi:hypothetical protein
MKNGGHDIRQTLPAASCNKQGDHLPALPFAHGATSQVKN